MSTTATIAKLLAYALDPAASSGESDNAATRAICLARKAGLTVSDLLGTAKPVTRFRVPPESMKFRFGKYRGHTLADVFAENPGYIRWLIREADNVAHIDPAFLRACEELLNN